MRAILMRALAGGTFLVAAEAAAEPPRLRLPVACELGSTCFIQNYVDRDPSSGAQDYRCGSLTYQGHNGTDFRLPTLAAQRTGVDVLAAAAGRVLRRRDGVPDVSVRTGGRAAVAGRECGNGVVLDHGGGWETQYCHMAQGSVRVAPGDAVEAGQPIGRVGLSGQTEYPHLHFTARHDGQVVDPFAFGAEPGTCGGGASLWDPALQQALAYSPSEVLNVGFAAGPVTMAAIDSGELAGKPLGPDAPALVAFVRAIGLKAGDVQRLMLTGPDGRVIADHRAEPLDRDKAQWMLFAGKRRPPKGWSPGTYTANYRVERRGAAALERSFELELSDRRP